VAPVRRGPRPQIPDQGVRRDGQQVLLLPVPEGLTEPGRPAHLVVPRHPGVGQHRPALVEHLHGQFVAGAEPHPLGHPGRLPPGLVRRPRLGQVQADVHQGVIGAGDVGQVHPDLTVLDLPEPPAPLPLDPDRGGPVLGEGGRVEHQDSVRLAPFRPDLAGQFGHQRPVVPGCLADELLEGLSVLVVVVGDGLDVLARDAGEESLEVAACVVPLLPA
jgi:hypothetical protein